MSIKVSESQMSHFGEPESQADIVVVDKNVSGLTLRTAWICPDTQSVFAAT